MSWAATSSYGYILPNIGNDPGSCTTAKTGELIYTGSTWEYCTGSAWTNFGSGIALDNINVELAAGSAAAPSLSFYSDTTTGLYQASSASHTLNFASGGAEVAAFDSTGDFNLTNTGGYGYEINGAKILYFPDNDTSSVALGEWALASQSSTGLYNVAIGQLALYDNATGANNIAIGVLALQSNTTGSSNTAIGESVLEHNTSGNDNTAIGISALNSITTGSYSTAVGYEALTSATATNTALGFEAGQYITSGSDNIAVGYDAMVGTSANPLTAASAGNIAIGDSALTAITGTDAGSVALGYDALNNSSGTGSNPNTAIGYEAMQFATTATNNTALGNLAMLGTSAHPMTGAGGNVAIGDSALTAISGAATGDTAVGYAALAGLTSATTSGTALGYEAGEYIKTGTHNVAIGYEALTSTSANPITTPGPTPNGNVAVGDLALTALTGGRSGNTAVGYEALTSDNSGGSNTALGYQAGEFITTGSANVAIGKGALVSTTANPLTAANAGNIAIGNNALTAITGAATSNVAIGYNALLSSAINSTAPNTAIGYEAMQYATTATNNTAIGNLAMQGNSGSPMTSGSNVAVGDSALNAIAGTANGNTAVGEGALFFSTTGYANTAIGATAMQGISGSPLTGNNNVALGEGALGTIQGSASNDTAIGDFALQNSTGSPNTALGFQAGQFVTSGSDNTLVGYQSGFGVTTGSHNIILGEDPSSAITSGSSNILIGNSLTGLTNTSSNQLDIGNTIYGNLSTGYVGIGTTTPAALLHVAGEVIIGNTGLACSATTAGAQRYDSVNNLVDYCNGTSWVALSQAAGPLAFSFTNQTGVNLSTTITSNTVTLTGFIGSLTATCSGCTAIAHNGVWGGTTVTGFATGDTIAIQLLSSASLGTAVTATATVGGTTSGTWSVTTTSVGPSAFSFTNVSSASTGITYTSNTVTLAGGFSGSLTATCSNCTGIALNGVWGVSPMTGFVNGSTIAIRQTSSSGLNTATTANVTVGTTTSSTWTVTTTAGCQTGITVGQACPDGTIYAGTSPDGSVPMYTTVCDSNQYWNGSACTACATGQWSGSGSTCNTTYSRAWNNGTSNWTVTGYTSATTGKANTAGLVALIDAGSPYNAANYCTSLSAYGHADFYLPAENELAVLYANKAAIANFDTTDGSTSVGGFYPGLYWTSTEYNASYAWLQRFSDGSQGYSGKVILLAVRCVRR